MELPAALREGVERALEGVALADLQRAADALSLRYRSETRDGRLHLSGDLEARAYLATRLPATYAAVRESLDRVAELRPEFAPRTLLDVGAGPGTALWAAAGCWPGLEEAALLEASPHIRALGEAMTPRAGLHRVQWRVADIAKALPPLEPADLVTLSYTLGELSDADGLALAERLWASTAAMLVVVEPGTPSGWRRMLAVRTRLMEQGARIVAPCAHTQQCPLREPDWCHFARRVARSRLHRLAKRADVPWEDEKYIYLAVAREPGEPAAARVLAPPKAGAGKIALKLCCADGAARERFVTRREGQVYKLARRVGWGDRLDAGDAPATLRSEQIRG